MNVLRALITSIGVGAAALSVAGAAAEVASDYASSMLLTTQGGEALYRIELPVAVYGGIQHADLSDLRVFNAANELVPFALADATPPAPNPSETFSPPVFPVWAVPGKRVDQLDVRIEQRADGTLTSIKTMGAPTRPNAPKQAVNYIIDATAIALPIAVMRPQWQTEPENYIGSARVEASDDLKDWKTIVAGASLVYLVQGQTRLAQDRILLPPTKAKYYRVTFGASAPMLSDMQMDAPALRGDPPRQSIRVPGHAGAKPGEIEFDLGVRAPVDRIRIDVRQSNALAPVRIESRFDARAEWRPVVTTIAYRIVRDGKEIASPDVPVAPNTSREWRAVVDAASGGLGTPPPELEASWPARNLVFVARGAGPFTLAFGKKDATRAALPLPSLIPGYRDQGENSLPAATIGALQVAPPPAPSLLPGFLADQEPQRIGLWAALIAGVLLLAAMAWKLSRQMQKGAAGTTAARADEPK